MQYQNGDIGFVMHHKNRLSLAIAWFMKSKWSHTFLIMDCSSEDRTYLSETSDYEITIGWLERYVDDPTASLIILRLPNLTDEDRAHIIHRALSQEEQLYPYWQFISLAIRGLFKMIGIKIRNFMPWGYNCCEHVHYALLGTSFYEINSIEPHQGDTEDFYQLISSIPGVTTVMSKNVS